MRKIALIMTVLAAISGCAAQPMDSSSAGSQPTVNPFASSDDAAESAAATEAAIDAERRVSVTDDDRELVILCEGEGGPTVVLEDGHPSETGGVSRFSSGALWTALAAQTRVCAYDRAGYGDSDPAPNEPRDADDVVDDLQALLAAAGEDGPYVLVGSSFGGMIVTYFASRDPQDIAGVVLLDVPAPTDTLSLDQIPEIAWDHPANPEHVDVIPEFETRFARDPTTMKAPLTVITASNGQSDVDDQGFWLALSPHATQVELDGGHDIDVDAPAEIAAEVMKLVGGGD